MAVIKLPGATHRDEDFALAPPVVEALWQMEDRHYWHRARNGWIVDALSKHGVLPPAHVLEVGCGSGAVARTLSLAGYTVTGVDTAEHLVAKAHTRCPELTLFVGDVGLLPEGHRGPYDALGFFDVLEHLEEPEALLRSALRWARPGTIVVATVPALQSLFGRVDELSGHKKRFERGELRSLLSSAGLGDVTEYGIFAATLPLQRLERRTSSERTPPAAEQDDVLFMRRALRVPPFPFNTALGWLTRVERSLGLERARDKNGASLLGVGHYHG